MMKVKVTMKRCAAPRSDGAEPTGLPRGTKKSSKVSLVEYLMSIDPSNNACFIADEDGDSGDDEEDEAAASSSQAKKRRKVSIGSKAWVHEMPLL